MPKKFNIDDKLDEIARTRPSVLKCSHSTANLIRKRSGELTDLGVLAFLSRLTIQPSDKIPNHLIFLCDAKGSELRMINLTERKAYRQMGVKREKKFDSN